MRIHRNARSCPNSRRLLVRRVEDEKLGAGRHFRPRGRTASRRRAGGSGLGGSSQWTVVKEARLALLDAPFARRAAPFPEVAANITGRALLRSRYLAITTAIIGRRRVDQRLTMLFWHLADRFGQTAPDGVHIPLPLTHRTISELIGVRRPSVTTALSQLQGRGVLAKVGRGWLLAGEPPVEMDRFLRGRSRAVPADEMVAAGA